MSEKTESEAKDVMMFDPLNLLNSFLELIENKAELDFLKGNNEAIQEKAKKLQELFNIADGIKKKAEKKLEDLQNNNNEYKDTIEDAKKEAEKGISEHLDWYEVHLNARKLWEALMSSAINYIDPSSKGNSKLFDYLEDSSKFEDVLYGLEEYYRDHTLHSIWVYLMGVQLMCEGGILSDVSNNLNWYLYNDIDTGKERYPYPDHLLHWAKLREDIFIKELQRYKDSVWCIMALCHDLGYSLAKLDKLNKRVLDVLKYFHITDFKRVGYSLDIEHQYLIEQFLEIMAMDVRIVPGEDYQDLEKDIMKEHYDWRDRFNSSLRIFLNDIKNQDKILQKIDESIKSVGVNKHNTIDVIENIYIEEKNGKTIINIFKDIEEQTLVKCYRDDSTYWRLCKALERKDHGILSAYLIYKILGIFADTSIRGASEEWGLEDQEVIYNIIRGDILFAIAQHGFEYTHIDQLGSLAEILIICDELEEFTRLGRKLQSRKYTDTTAETGIKIIKIKNKNNDNRIQGDPILLELKYKSMHKKPKEFCYFFWRKLRRLCTLYSLDQNRDTNEKVYFPIKEIKIHFEYKKDMFISIMKIDVDNEIKFTSDLPLEAKDDKCSLNEDEINKIEGYELECVDDKIYVKIKDRKEKTGLKKWLGIKD